MEITTVTTIELEDKEIDALQTLKRAQDDCACNDYFQCNECPIDYNGTCIGLAAMVILDRLKKGDK